MENQDTAFADTRKKLGQAAALVDQCAALEARALAGISLQTPPLKEEAAQRERETEEARSRFHEGLATPVIRIAAIGTTSSAKSTLLNFLCGASILPTGVQEKSAGVTRIINSDAPGLHISATAGAFWETGEIKAESAREIRNALEDAMDRFRQAVQNGQELEPPSFTVLWPVAAAETLGIPSGFRLELLDLPGLKYTGDEANRKLIAECKDSLCVVAFGAHETDPVKQAAFLEDALEQIMMIGAPLERMFFTVTRIDEFLLKDSDHWPDNEDAFIADRKRAIREGIARKIPSAETGGIRMHAISPQPALLCLELLDPSKRFDAWKEIRKSYLGLVEGGAGRDKNAGIDVWALSAPKYALWTDEDWSQIIDQLLLTTGAESFLQALRGRLSRNLLSIILPPPASRFIDVAEDMAQWGRSGAELARARVRGDAQNQISLLKESMARQEEINARARKQLESYFDQWLKRTFSFSGPDNEAQSGQRETGIFFVPEMEELTNWPDMAEAAFKKPINAIADSLANGSRLPDGLPLREKLANCCTSLWKAGYHGRSAFTGMQAQAYVMQQEAKAKAQEMKQLQHVFEDFQKICDESANLALEAAMASLFEKTVSGLEALQKRYLVFLNEESAGLPPEIRAVGQITPHGLARFARLRLARKKAAVINTIATKKTEHEEIEESAFEDTGNLLRDAIYNAWLWVTRNHNVKKMITRIRFTIDIPSLYSLQEEYSREFARFAPDLFQKLEDSARKKMSEFFDSITEYQQALFSAYDQNLQKVIGEKVQNAKIAEEAIEASLRDISSAMEKVCQIRELYKSDGEN